MKVSWTREALTDLDRIDTYFAEIDRAYANRTIYDAGQAARFLKTMPLAGSMLRNGTRKWKVARSPYILLYRVTEKQIEILRLRHERENWRASDE